MADGIVYVVPRGWILMTGVITLFIVFSPTLKLPLYSSCEINQLLILFQKFILPIIHFGYFLQYSYSTLSYLETAVYL